MQDLMRGARDLTTAVAAMRADFTSAHTAMAKQARKERGAFVASVTQEVNSLLGAFSRERDEMARKGRHDRTVFLMEMRRQVTGMCKDTADDLLGARLAWRGRSSVKSRPVQVKEEPVIVKPLSPPVETAPAESAAAPLFKTESPPVSFIEPPAGEGEKETVVEVLQTPTDTPSPAENLDEKSAKAAARMKRGGKQSRGSF